MDRRYFLCYSTVTATILLSGCEKDINENEQQKLPTSTPAPTPTPTPTHKEEKIAKITLFNQELKIPKEIDFGKIKQTEFRSQKNHIQIYPDKQTEI